MGALVDVRPGEKAPLALAMAALGLSTAGHTLLETARDALFLSKLPPSVLPWMYITIAALGVVLTQLLPKQRSASIAPLALIIAAVAAAGFWVLLADPTRTGLYLLFVWAGTFGAIVSLELWLLLGTTFDVGQAKRLFGLAGAGAVLGATLGALVARVLAGFVAPRQLLLAGGIAFLAAAAPALMLDRLARAHAKPAEGAAAKSAPSTLLSDLKAVFGSAYLRRIGAFLALGTITLAVADYVFKSTLAARVDKEHLATAFATAYLGFNGLSLVVQVGLTGFALRTLGVQRALLVLPIAVALTAGAMFGLATLAAAVALRASDGAFRYSIYKTTTELLFLPLSDAERRRAKPVLDLVTQRGGQALAALLVAALVALGFGERGLAVVTLALAAAWAGVATQLGAPYVDAFRRVLVGGRVQSEGGVPDLDLGALEAIFAALNSSRDAEVMGALDLLAAQGRGKLIPALILYHPSKDVVLRGLAHLVLADRRDVLPITQRLLDHADPEVRAAALRARPMIGGDPAELERFVIDPRPEMRATALVALQTQEGSRSREGELRAALDKGDELVRIAVFRAMAAAPDARLVDTLLSSARSEPHHGVRGALASALGAHARTVPSRLPEILEALVSFLIEREEGLSAKQALVSIGEPAAGFIDQRLRAEDATGPNAWALARTLGAFPAATVVVALQHHLARSPDAVVRFRCLRHLRRMVAEDPELPIDRAAISVIAESTLQVAGEHLASRVAVEAGQVAEPERATAAGKLLVALLRDKQQHAQGRLFMLLKLLLPYENFDRVERGLSSGDAKTRASSREVCDNVIKGALHDRLMTLIDDIPDPAKVERLGLAQAGSYTAALSALGRSDAEVVSLTRYHAAELQLTLASERGASSPIHARDALIVSAPEVAYV